MVRACLFYSQFSAKIRISAYSGVWPASAMLWAETTSATVPTLCLHAMTITVSGMNVRCNEALAWCEQGAGTVPPLFLL
jgi:hypothetical protein